MRSQRTCAEPVCCSLSVIHEQTLCEANIRQCSLLLPPITISEPQMQECSFYLTVAQLDVLHSGYSLS